MDLTLLFVIHVCLFVFQYFSRIGDEWVFKKRLRAGQKDPSL